MDMDNLILEIDNLQVYQLWAYKWRTNIFSRIIMRIDDVQFD